MICFWQTSAFLDSDAIKEKAQNKYTMKTNCYAKTVVVEIVKSIQTNLCRSNFINMQGLNV